MVVPNDNSLAAATVFNSGVPTFSSVTFQNTSLSTVDDILRVKKKEERWEGVGRKERRLSIRFPRPFRQFLTPASSFPSRLVDRAGACLVNIYCQALSTYILSYSFLGH